ncbi:hypothetical protein OIU76_009914 [Salix suchowensis]|nr:hypothetical protein OIU76_009914 [Salix suchowensis]
MGAFLWRGCSLETTGAKVAWRNLCFPLSEDGLGIKSLRVWNQVAVMKHIWNLMVGKDSIWVHWVRKVLLKGRPFWSIPIPSKPTWSWKKILQGREFCRGLFRCIIGNGELTSLWYDYWLPNGKRICDLASSSEIRQSNLHQGAKVADIIHGSQWVFPQSSQSLQAIWNSISFFPNPSIQDVCVWGDKNDSFSVFKAWRLLRQSNPTSTSMHLCWFKFRIPRHAFILWLAIKGRLRTMDRLYDHEGPRICKLCSLEDETHEHLFLTADFLMKCGLGSPQNTGLLGPTSVASI